MNMFKSTTEKTVEEYLARVPVERQELMCAVHGFILKTVPKLTPYFASNMIGYGSFPWRSYKMEMIDWPIIALANQKNYVSVYVCAIDDGEYIAEKYKAELGKVAVGKSCIQVKKLSDLNLTVFKKILRFAASHPGLSAPGAK